MRRDSGIFISKIPESAAPQGDAFLIEIKDFYQEIVLECKRMLFTELLPRVNAWAENRSRPAVLRHRAESISAEDSRGHCRPEGGHPAHCPSVFPADRENTLFCTGRVYTQWW